MEGTRTTKRRVRLLVVLTALIAVLAGSFVAAGSASADLPLAVGKKVYMTTAISTGSCNFYVNQVEPSTLQAKITLNAAIKPTQLSGYVNNIYSEVFCVLYSGTSSTAYAFWNPKYNSAAFSNKYAKFTVPYEPSYILCGQTFVKLRNGNTVISSASCA